MASNFLKELGRKEILVPHLNGWFGRGKFPDIITFSIRPNKEKDDAFHPSSDAVLCARTLYAKRHDHLQARPLMADSYKTFFFGHYFHSMMQHILVQELGFARIDDIEKEVRRHGNGWWARGFIDIAHCVIPGRGDFLVDIKTMGSHDYRMQKPRKYLWDKYHAQVQMYLDWEDMERAIILCAEKDSPHRFKELYVDRDRDFAESVYERWTRVISAENPPPCDCEFPDDCPSKGLYT